MKKMMKASILVMAVLLLAACQPGSSGSVNLSGTSWQLSSLGGALPISGTSATLEFGTDGSLTGSDSCNRFMTTYVSKNDSLTVTQPAAGTLMACDENIMKQADAYSAALAATKSFTSDGTSLILKDAAGKILATFVVISQDLNGTAWNVVQYNNGKEAVVSLIEGTVITAGIADDQVAGSAGCNNYFAGFKVDGKNITIEAPGSTRMMCEAPEGVMEQEAAFLAALESAATFSNRGNSLEFRTAADQIAVILVPAH